MVTQNEASAILVDLHHHFTQHLVGGGKAHATVIAYSKDIEQFVEFAGKKGLVEVQQVTAELIDEFKELLKKQRYTTKSISRKINSIKSFFRYVVGLGILTDSPAESVVHPRLELVPPRILPRIEYRALRDACRGDARMAAIVELLLQTGMRISELAAMQLNDVDFDRNIIYVKAQNSRTARKVPMNKAAKASLLAYLQVRPRARERVVFLTKTCRPFLIRNI